MEALLTKKQAAALLHVSTRTIERMVGDGRLKKTPVRGLRDSRFRREDVEALLADA